MKNVVVLDARGVSRDPAGLPSSSSTRGMHSLEVRSLHRGDPGAVETLSATELLVVMGGSMGVSDLGDNPEYTLSEAARS